MVQRYYFSRLHEWLKPNKVLVLYGPRQVGKTTLIRSFIDNFSGRVFSSTGEDADLQRIMTAPGIRQLKTYFEDYDLVFIDEAQMIPNIGMALKMMVDYIPGLKVIATGSSSFELSNKVGEPLVGRQHILRLYPVALLELKPDLGWATVKQRLEEYVIDGLYPELFNLKGRQAKIDYLLNLRDSYLLKDLLMLDQIKGPKKIQDLLRLLAFQIGNDVSIQELGKQLGMSKNTVARYLDLLEKSFILINVRGFSRNLRKEVTKTSRYYFYDNGVLNAVINNFNSLELREDKGRLWENFLFMERMKKREYHRIPSNYYFWRTYSQKEIDLVEERDGQLFAYEFKYQPKKMEAPVEWQKGYPDAAYEVISRDNLEGFVL